MRNSKFLNLLRTLDARELKEYENYLCSLHYKKKIAIKVFRYVKKFKPDFNQEDLEKKTAYRKIFRRESFNYRKIMDSASDLYLILEDFLVDLELKEQAFERDYLLIQNLKRRNADKQFDKKMQEMEEGLEGEKKIDFWHCLNKLRLAHTNYYKSNTEKLSLERVYIREAMKNLDLFFVGAKLKYSCELYSRESLLQENIPIHLLKGVLDLCEEQKIENNLFNELFQSALKVISYRKFKDYFFLKKNLLENSQLLFEKDKHIITSYLLNYITWEINQGNKKFIAEAFELYKFAIDHGFLTGDGSISAIRFYNIVDVACHQGELNWLKKFVAEWGIFIEAGKRDNVISLGTARIHFEEKEFDEVIALINRVKFHNIIYAIRAKTLELRSFYELDTNMEFLESKCIAFNIFLKRNKTLNEEVKTGSLNFIKVFKNLIRPQPDGRALQKKVIGMKFLICRDWLLQKIMELK